MKVTRTFGRTATAGLVGAIALTGLGTSAYAASSSGSSTSLPSSAISSPATHSSAASLRGHAPGTELRRMLARADAATIEVKVKGEWVVYDIDRGNVSAVSASSITLSLPDGKSVTDSITSTTKFEGVKSESAITVGHKALVTSTNGTALRIHQGH